MTREPEGAPVAPASGEANPGFWSRADGRLAKVEGWLATFAGFIAVAMTGAILFDVLSRAVTNQSVGWGTDLTEMFMYLLTYVAAGYVARQGGHVRVDLVIERLTPRVNRRLSVLTTLLALFFALLLTTQGWSAWLGAIASGKATSSVHIPQFWFAVVIPIGSFILALELAILVVRHVGAIVKEGHTVAGRAATPVLATGVAEGE